MTPPLVVGIDSGGTTTRAALASADGAILGMGEAPGGNVQDLGAGALVETVRAALNDAFHRAGCTPTPARAAFLGVAGCGNSAAQDAIRACLHEAGDPIAEVLDIDHDLRVAHAGAFLGEPGAVLIVGTGACCYGRTAAGEECRAGGWGGRLDDGGSGAWIGQQALAECLRAEDGRGSQTTLRAGVLDVLGASTLREAVGQLEVPGWRARFAAITPVVAECAAADDHAAAGIIARGASALADMATPVLHRLENTSTARQSRLAATGGVIRHCRLLRDCLSGELAARGFQGHIEHPRLSPVCGAVLLAMELLGPVSLDAREALSGRTV